MEKEKTELKYMKQEQRRKGNNLVGLEGGKRFHG